MSHAVGHVFISRDNQQVSIGFFEYNGTCDLTEPYIHLTIEDMWKHWRKQPWKECTCHAEPTPAHFLADYGGGVEWDGAVCLNCMVIVQGLDPYADYCPVCNSEMAWTWGGGKECLACKSKHTTLPANT